MASDGSTANGDGTAREHLVRTLARSVAAGTGCYLAGFALVAGLFAVDFTRNVSGGAGGDPVRGLQRLGWVVYNAHLVRTRVGLYGLNFIELSADPLALPRALYYAVPPVVLVAGGWLAARRAPPGVRRVVAGTGVAAGYLPAAVLGVLAVTTPEGGPELVPAVLLAGVAYPVAFGTVGGLVADRQ